MCKVHRFGMTSRTNGTWSLRGTLRDAGSLASAIRELMHYGAGGTMASIQCPTGEEETLILKPLPPEIFPSR